MKRDNNRTGINEKDLLDTDRAMPVVNISEDLSGRAVIPPRFDVTAAEIDRIVQIFYAAVRSHDVLGPIFAGHVTDWSSHEAKIASFWKKTILHQPGYEGNPMQVHLAAGDVKAAHFRIWLSLFDETLHGILSPETATAWSALAHRIGRGLRIGVEDMHNKPGQTPILR